MQHIFSNSTDTSLLFSLLLEKKPTSFLNTWIASSVANVHKEALPELICHLEPCVCEEILVVNNMYSTVNTILSPGQMMDSTQ